MVVFRVLGILFLLAAAAALTNDLVAGGAGGFRLSALGELWFRLSPYTLDLSRAVTERYIWPALWDPVAVWVLLQPAVLVLGAVGLALMAVGMAGRRR
ncbi:hypothetical protein HL658_11415 [Azospirillum sp. RWY-5-1]|uniref:Uncharacterized protein n=1 Tax=Azospirillum oleiclasticum TaxID=2735135 RepID=A0ABX2TAW2_9PROT|nr:hypothetical protein [Azospirillum oleiclasticum]NYZ13163.1 hypothetical protein [Azospirillum oleiclasticum]NYZ20164.1 hypothetical protein [Azospirillum oleiclasticum]